MALKQLIIYAALTVVAVAQPPAFKSAVEISSAIAEEHLLNRVDTLYLHCEKCTATGQGHTEDNCLESGAVSEVKTISGHPLLIPAAIDAVKHWKYEPFVVQGSPIEGSTLTEVLFSLGIQAADYKKEEEAADRYFMQEHRCQELLQQHPTPLRVIVYSFSALVFPQFM